MRYDDNHKKRTHEKIVQEAAKAIRQKGPAEIGIAGLMSRLGLTHGGFYAHFKSKDRLVSEAIIYMFEERFDALRCYSDCPDPAEGLSGYIDIYLSTKHRDRRDLGCPIVALGGDVSRMPKAARQHFEKGILGVTDFLAGMLKALNKAQPTQLAASVLAEMVGAMVMARAVSDTGLSDQILENCRHNVRARIGLSAPS